METVTNPVCSLAGTDAEMGQRVFPESQAAELSCVRALSAQLFSFWLKVERWQERAKQRRHLRELDDRILRDIGVSRADIDREYRKPFWKE